MIKFLCAGLCLSGLLATLANAQSGFSLAAFSIDGGGVVSSGGNFSVSAALGHPDAGKLTGGVYGLDGGFWAVVATLPPVDPPLLSIQFTATNTVVLSWPVGSTTFLLQESASLGPTNWTPVTTSPTVIGNENRVVAPTQAARKFYRLQSQ